jgi:hypothetical protein
MTAWIAAFVVLARALSATPFHLDLPSPDFSYAIGSLVPVHIAASHGFTGGASHVQLFTQIDNDSVTVEATLPLSDVAGYSFNLPTEGLAPGRHRLRLSVEPSATTNVWRMARTFNLVDRRSLPPRAVKDFADEIARSAKVPRILADKSTLSVLDSSGFGVTDLSSSLSIEIWVEPANEMTQVVTIQFLVDEGNWTDLSETFPVFTMDRLTFPSSRLASTAGVHRIQVRAVEGTLVSEPLSRSYTAVAPPAIQFFPRPQWEPF